MQNLIYLFGRYSHGGLQPSNVLVNGNCDLKIRNVAHTRMQETWTGRDIFTQYYPAPEVMFSWQVCTEYIDIWGPGFILTELLQTKVLSPGQSLFDKLYLIMQLLGILSQVIMDQITIEEVCSEISYHCTCKSDVRLAGF